ncbi:hypothetical protein ACFXGZ_09740, partial [Streptomyces sp. NPDC059271]
MSRDAGEARRPRSVKRAWVGWPRPLQELKDLLYEVYLAAGAPSLDDIAADIGSADAEDLGVSGAPGRDTVRRVISDPGQPPSQADVVSVAVVLARRAAWDAQDLAARVRELWVKVRMAVGEGRPLREFDDRLVLADLEVHPALDAGADLGRIGVLPAYIRREHDTLLDAVVAAAAAGRSGIAVLVGGSSTGKTRALWEAVRALPDDWRLWHPLSPTRPDAVLAGLPGVAPRTVVWLNEAQDYLVPDTLGEQVAAGLRTLLHDATRGPVLVLATLWPRYWQTLTTRTAPDLHSQSRQLLGGHEINVAEKFGPADMAALAQSPDADPRLAEAAERSQDGQVTQYLAGVPVLLSRYRNAKGTPATLALIHAAMDVRRLGAGPRIPLAWLADAAPGYLTDSERNAADEDWLTRALDYVTQDCNGIPGILTPVRTTGSPNQRPRPGTISSPGWHTQPHGPQYRLADYLDQHGRHRADEMPPVAFWTAAAIHAHPADLTALGNAAWARGLYRDSVQLHKNATTHGNPHAAVSLTTHFHHMQFTDPRPAQWAATHADLNDSSEVAALLNALRKAGADEQASALIARNPAAQADLHQPFAVAGLLDALREVGADEQASALIARNPAAQADLHQPFAVASLLLALQEVGADEQVTTLTARNPAAYADLDNPFAVAMLSFALLKAGAHEQVTTLHAAYVAHIVHTVQADLNDPAAVTRLLVALRKARADEQVSA